MTKDNISPEEKLLRLIRGQKKQDISIDKKPLNAITGLKPKVKNSIYPLIPKYLSFPYIQKIIGIVFVVSCIFLIISFIYPWFGLRKIKLPQVTEEKMVDLKTEPRLEPKPYESYSEGIIDRQIFSSPTAQETQGPSSGVDIDLIKDINLVGIISGENPQAIIEDKKTQKTYYLSKGQFIGEFQVEDIREGKVILNFRGQRYELYL